MAGTVIARGAGVTVAEGARVLCGGTQRADRSRMWGGHISHAVLHQDAAIAVPENVSLLDASIAKLGAIAYHGLRLSRPQPHETVAAVGLGPIGMLAARLYAVAGARVVAADLSPERVALAQAAGIEAFVPSGSLAEAFQAVIPDGADIVVDSTGVPSVMGQAVALARDVPWSDAVVPGARFLIQGSYPGDFPVPYQAAFIKELTIMLPRDQQPRDQRTVLNLIAAGKLHVGDLITEVRRPDDAPQIYAALRAAQPGLMTAAFDWT
jgi:2-desacetyl-2-hydroxyethyl bacteriochlorophyllide A dehydrogenase